MLRQLKVRTKAKLGLSIVFSLAFLDVVFEILRGCEFITTQALTGGCELWMNLESAVAVIVSCLPSLVALSGGIKSGRRPSTRATTNATRSLIISATATKIMNTSTASNNRTESTATAVGSQYPSTKSASLTSGTGTSFDVLA